MVLVSVVMSSYNYDKYISEAIESVLNQSEIDFELIIIDDCSRDESRRIISRYQLKDSRIRTIFHESNKGMARSLNDGLKIARGKFVAFIDSDDIWDLKKLEMQLKVLSEDDDLVVWTEGEIIDKFNNPTGDKFTNLHSNPKTKKSADISEDLLYGNFILGSSLILKKENLPPNGFDEKLTYLNDYRFAFDLSMRNQYFFIEHPLVKYRIHGKNCMFSNWKKWQQDDIKLSNYILEKYGNKIPKKAKSNLMFRMARSYSRIGKKQYEKQIMLTSIMNNPLSRENLLYFFIDFYGESSRLGQISFDFYYLTDLLFSKILMRPTSPIWWWRIPPHKLYVVK